MALREVKDHLSSVVERVAREHERVVITRHGEAAAVIISVDDWESMEETLDILSDPEEAAAVRAGIAEIDRGEGIKMTKDEFLAYLRGEGDDD